MCEKHVGQCFVLRVLHRSPSHSSVFTFCFPSLNIFFYDGISQSVLTWLKYYCFFLAQNQKCSKYFSSFTGL